MGHNFWLECPSDLRSTPLSYIFNALFRDTSLAYLLSRRVCHIYHVTTTCATYVTCQVPRGIEQEEERKPREDTCNSDRCQSSNLCQYSGLGMETNTKENRQFITTKSNIIFRTWFKKNLLAVSCIELQVCLWSSSQLLSGQYACVCLLRKGRLFDLIFFRLLWGKDPMDFCEVLVLQEKCQNRSCKGWRWKGL